jgi:hypothetical protein
MAEASALAYYDTATNMSVKSFIVQAPEERKKYSKMYYTNLLLAKNNLPVNQFFSSSPCMVCSLTLIISCTSAANTLAYCSRMTEMF